MADNVPITAGTGTNIAADDLSGVYYQRVKLALGADGVAVDAGAGAGAVGTDTQRVTLASDDPLVAAVLGVGATVASSITTSTGLTYTVNRALADATPTAGGFPITGAARVSGGSGTIKDVIGLSSIDATIPAQLELWIFSGQVTAIADNGSFALSDADSEKLVAVIPLTFGSTNNTGGTNAWAGALSGAGFTCVGSANLYYLVKMKNAYVRASSEKFTFIFKLDRNT